MPFVLPNLALNCAPNAYLRPDVPLGYVLSFTVREALRTIGCRGTIFILGSELNARYVADVDHSLSYEGETLMVKLGFDTFKEARAAWQTLERTHGRPSQSPLSGRLWLDSLEIAIQDCPRGNLGSAFAVRDYTPETSESPDWAMSEHSWSLSETTVLDGTSDLVRYQRIGGGRMSQIFAFEKCHLIPNAQCRDVEFTKYQRNPNNFLAMIRQLHQAFDGIETDNNIPILLIELVSIGATIEIPSAPDRTEVFVRGHFLNKGDLDTMMNFFEDGTTVDRGRGTFLHTVKVLDPKVFAFCLQWKARQTLERWFGNGYQSIAKPIEDSLLTSPE